MPEIIFSGTAIMLDPITRFTPMATTIWSSGKTFDNPFVPENQRDRPQ